MSVRRLAVNVGCLTAVAVGLLATGCSAGVADRAAAVMVRPPAIAASPAPPVTGYGGLMGLPLSAYGPSEQDDARLFTVRKALVVRCMKTGGYRGYSGQNLVRFTVRDIEAVHPVGAWGYIGRATAKRQGFHALAAPTGDATAVTGKERQDFEACAGKVDKQLPDVAGTAGWTLTERLFDQSIQQTGADQRVAGARKRWAACMAAAGHPAEDPEKLAAGPWKTAKPTADEIAAATADQSCTTSSSLAGIYFAVLTGYQQELVSANAAALTAYQKQVRAQTGKIAHLLTELPAS